MAIYNWNHDHERNLLIFLVVSLVVQSISAWPFSGNSFHKFLDTLTGKKKVDYVLYFDEIYENIAKYSQKPKYAPEIPTKLIEISKIKLENCNNMLADRLRYELAPHPTSFDAQYFDFYARWQYNLCLQEMELKRAKLAAKNMDKSKWAFWYGAIEARTVGANGDINARNVALKLAIHLKRFVPKVESKNFPERVHHVGMIATEIRKIINEVCQYVNGDALTSDSYDKRLFEFLDKNRSEFKADPISSVWSKSAEICSDEREQNKLIGLVVNIFVTQLDSINMKDKSLNDISESRIVKDYLLLTHGDIPAANSIRMGNPIDILQRFADIASDENDKQIANRLLSLGNISDEIGACQEMSIKDRKLSQQTYANANYTILRGYVKSLNALQFNLCDLMIRYEAAKLAINLSPNQLALLQEFRHIFDTKRMTLTDSSGLLREPLIGYGHCAKAFINRYKDLDREWKRNLREARELVSGDSISDWLNEDRHNSVSDRLIADATRKVKSWYTEIMGKTCANVLTNLHIENVDKIRDLLQFRPEEKLGQTESLLFDYAILCTYKSSYSGLTDFMEALG